MSEDVSLRYEFTTDRPEDQELCRWYWERQNGRFTHNTQELVKRYRLRNQTALVEKVMPLCRAYAIAPCSQCGSLVETQIYKRTDFNNWVGNAGHCRDNLICASCWSAGHRPKERSWRPLPSHPIKPQNTRDELIRQKKQEMEAAFEAGVYEGLTDLEFNTLLEFVRIGDGEKAAKVVGISYDNFLTILDKLAAQNIIANFKGDGNCWIVPAFKEVLLKMSQRRRARAILVTPKSRELYRLLKREYLFVFPEMPLSVVIDKAHIKHLFTEAWHEDYFLKARVDFVVCDRESNPLFVVEYDGGYHNDDPHRRKLDGLKEMFLAEVGIPVQRRNQFGVIE